MARKAGPIFITGSIDNLCFYKMGGQYYVRKKSSLDGKRVRRDKAFAVTMKNAELMGKGSSVASSVYRLVPVSCRGIVLFRAITSAAISLLRKGDLDRDGVVLVLKRKFVESCCPKPTQLSCEDRSVVTGFADMVLSRIFQVEKDKRIWEPGKLIARPP